MRWFKHMSDASEDEFLAELEDLFGLEGYARYFKLLEAIAIRMKRGSTSCSTALPWSKWQEILKGKRKKLETFLEHLENKQKIFLKCSGNILEIGIPNLLKYRDEYQKKSGHAPDKLRPKSTETETEEEKKEKTGKKETGRKRPLPPNFQLADAMRMYAEGKGLTPAQTETEFEKFCNHAGANNVKRADWEKAFRNWIIKALEFERERRPDPGHRKRNPELYAVHSGHRLAI